METGASAGPIEKSVSIASNDPAHPTQVLQVRADVQGDLHEMSSLNTRKSIFSLECQSCHVDEGVGKMGRELYQADCAMCHGSLDEADHVRALNGPRLAEDLAELRKMIAFGNERRAMPGFSTAAGGPLTDAQIDSLVDLFRKWEKKEKQRHNSRP